MNSENLALTFYGMSIADHKRIARPRLSKHPKIELRGEENET